VVGTCYYNIIYTQTTVTSCGYLGDQFRSVAAGRCPLTTSATRTNNNIIVPIVFCPEKRYCLSFYCCHRFCCCWLLLTIFTGSRGHTAPEVISIYYYYLCRYLYINICILMYMHCSMTVGVHIIYIYIQTWMKPTADARRLGYRADDVSCGDHPRR